MVVKKAVKGALGGAKAAGKGARKVGEWAVPTDSLDDLVEKALNNKDVKQTVDEAVSEHGYSKDELEDRLRSYIEKEREDTKGMRYLSLTLDSANKAMVPLDSALDYLNVMGGAGAGSRALLTLVRSPGYLAYDAYYLGKTHDLKGTLGNLAYEGLSWLSPGALPHLLNRYSHQASKYIVDSASDRFVNSLKGRLDEGEEDKIIDIPSEEKSERKKAA